MITNVLIFGVLIPAAILGVFLLLGQPPWRERAPLGAGWGLAVGLGAGYLAGWYGIQGVPEHPQSAVALAVLAGLIEFGLADRAAVGKRADWLRWPLRAAAPLVIGWVMFGWVFQNVWETSGVKVLGASVVVLGTAGLIGTLDEIARRRPGATVPLAIWVLASGSAAYMLTAGSARAGMMFGTLAGLAGTVLVHAWLKGSLAGATTMARGGAVVWGMLFAVEFMAGHFGAFEPPTGPALLLVVAPHVLWIGELGPLGKLEGWKGTLVRFVLVAATTGVAVGWARSVGGPFMY